MKQILKISDFLNRFKLTQNIKESDFNSEALVVQEQSLEYVLCTETYEEFISQWSDGGEAYLDAKYQKLYPFIKDFLIFKTGAQLIFTMDYLSTPAGLRKKVSDISDSVSQQEKRSLISVAENRAEFYQDKLIDYLTKNKKDFPLWESSRCGCGRFSSGINRMRFGNSKRNPVKINLT